MNPLNPLKPYPSIDVTMQYQNFGSAFLIILRGSQDNIELVFNSLFNFCATNGQLEYPEQTKTVATFWSDDASLRKYFALRFEFAPVNSHLGKDIRKGCCPKLNAYVESQMAALRDNHEFFLDFSRSYIPDVYNRGSITAERPDEDLRDMFVSQGFKDKGEKVDSNVEIE